MVGGMQEVVMGGADDETELSAGKDSQLHEEVIKEQLALCARVLGSDGGDEGLTGAELMLRTRLLKSFWELLGIKATKKVRDCSEMNATS